MLETEVDDVPAEVQAPAKSPIAEVQAPAKIVEEHEEAGPVRKFPIDAGLQKKLRQNFPWFVKKGAKKKTELQEKFVITTHQPLWNLETHAAHCYQKFLCNTLPADNFFLVG